MGEQEPDFRRLARECPHCGAREPTLGSLCPSCGRSYEPQSWVDRGPLHVDDWLETGNFGAPFVFAFASAINLVFALIGAILTGGFRVARAAGRRVALLGRAKRP